MKIQDFAAKKQRGERISMVTCYDAWSARLITRTDIDCLLVGDSLAMVVYGHESTLPADIDTMAAHTAAVGGRLAAPGPHRPGGPCARARAALPRGGCPAAGGPFP